MPVQTPNALLPLSVQTAQPVSAFQAGRRDATQNRLLETNISGEQQRQGLVDTAATNAENDREKQAATIESFRNIEAGVKQLSPLLDQVMAGADPAQFMAGLEERRTQLIADGKPTEDTDLAIQTAQAGNFGAVRQLFDQVLKNGQLLDASELNISPQTQTVEPSDVRSFKFFNNLSPEEQTEFIKVKRASGQIVDIGGVPNIVDKETQTVTPLSTLTNEVDAATTEAGAVAGAQAKARNEEQISALPQKTEAQAKIDLPAIESTTNQGIDLIDSILDDPGLPAVIGFLQGRTRGLTGKQRGLVKKIEQVQGKVFLDAFERLKGGGQITELEGKAATDAQARINDRTVDEAAFSDAMLELRETMDLGLGRARAAAGVSGEGGSDQPTVIDFNDLSP